MYDVIVIGGGIVGTATAYHLVRGGAKTLLIDRQDAGRATDAGAGILSAETYSGDSDEWFTFALAAADYYPVLIAALQPFTDGDLGYSACRKLTVALGDDELAAFEKTRSCVLARQQVGKGPARDGLYEVTPAAVGEIFPWLAPVRGALYFTGSARVDGRRLTAAMLRAARDGGLIERHGNVERLLVQNNATTGVALDDEEIHGVALVVAGGAWSSSFEAQLGVRIPVEPQRGQLAHLRVTGIDTADWPIVEGFHGHYIVPWPDGRVVAGATRETNSGFGVEPTAAGLNEVLHEACRVIPVLRDAELLEVRVGLRPLSIDRMPILGSVPNVVGAFLATGHGSTGLQLGPYSGKAVADLVLGIPGADLSPFEINRFDAV